MIEDVSFYQNKEFLDNLFYNLRMAYPADYKKVSSFIFSKNIGELGVVSTHDINFLGRSHTDKTWKKYNQCKWDESFSINGEGISYCIYWRNNEV